MPESGRRRRPRFEDGDELMLVLEEYEDGRWQPPERWSFNEVVAELEKTAEAASNGDRRSQRVYERVVYAMRRERRGETSDDRFAEGES